MFWELLGEHLSVSPEKAYVHKDLAPARIRTDLEAVGKVVDLLEFVFSDPWALSEGVAATTEVRYTYIHTLFIYTR